jgi:Family of unknown function (DUF6527)
MKFEFLTVDLDDCPPDQAPVFFGFECPKRTDGFLCSGLVIRGNPAGLKPENKTWLWNGNREKPTFQPSIDCKNCSHGFIENGEWREGDA